jgi:hypothetical protein
VPHLEYAAPVWQGSNGCYKLDSIQRKGLAICSGGVATGSREALEVELGILPLALRREELSVRSVGKILAKEVRVNQSGEKECVGKRTKIATDLSPPLAWHRHRRKT